MSFLVPKILYNKTGREADQNSSTSAGLLIFDEDMEGAFSTGLDNA